MLRDSWVAARSEKFDEGLRSCYTRDHCQSGSFAGNDRSYGTTLKVKLLVLRQKTESPSNSGIDITEPAQTHSNKFRCQNFQKFRQVKNSKFREVRIPKIFIKSWTSDSPKSDGWKFSLSPGGWKNFSKSETQKFLQVWTQKISSSVRPRKFD